MEGYVYSIHVGGKPDNPRLEEVDSSTCERVWDYFWDELKKHNSKCRWGRTGLGTIELHPKQMGYDLHVVVTLENKEPVDAWMWQDRDD